MNAHGEHVQENGRKDENERGLAPRRADFHAGLIHAPVHQRRFRPAKGLALPRSVSRIGVPGSAKASRKPLIR
jgi:hypothetical protein